MFMWRKQVKAIEILKTDPDLSIPCYYSKLHLGYLGKAMYPTEKQLVCLCVGARLHVAYTVQITKCDHLLSVNKRETTDPFVECCPQKKSTESVNMKMNIEIISQKRSKFNPLVILSTINQKHWLLFCFEINHDVYV